MCGRFRLKRSWKEVHDLYNIHELAAAPNEGERHNIAPTQRIPVCRRIDGERQLTMMKWGLIPSWSKDDKAAARCINARSDTVREKASFRSAFKAGRRCLIPMDGYYEWSVAEDGKSKLPWLFSFRPGERLFSAAGIYETWNSPAGPIESVAMLTTDANEVVAPIHDRMPVIIHRMKYDKWLSPDTTPDEAHAMCIPYNEPQNMQVWRVSTDVNSSRFTGEPARV